MTLNKQFINELTESEALYRALFENANEGILLLSLKTEILGVNYAFAKMHGYTPEEMQHLRLEDLDVDDLSEIAPERHRRISAGEALEFEVRHYHKDGHILSFEVSAYRVQRGDEVCSVAFHRDITDRKKGAAEILTLKAAMDASGEAIFMTDTQGVFTFVNPQFTKLYGFTSVEVIGKETPRIIKSGLMKPKDYEIFWQTLGKGIVTRGEFINRTKDGRLLTIDGSANAIQNENGEIVGFLAIQRDITERKEYENILEEIQVKIGLAELDHTLVEKSSEGFWLLDKNFNTTFVNPAMEEMLGYSSGEMIGRSWYSFGDPDWVARAKELERRREAGVVEPHEFLFLHKTGHKILTRIATTPLYNEKGEFNGALGVLSDITHQREAEEALKMKDMLSSLAESAGIGLTILNSDYTIAWHNDLHENGPGSAEHISGRNCFEVFEGRDSTCPDCPAGKTFLTSKNFSVEKSRVIASGGEPRHFIFTTTPIFNKSGEVIQIARISQDITERKQAEMEKSRLETQLQQSQKMESVGRLAGGIAHDFNNMLAVILGHAEMAMANLDATEPIYKSLQEIMKAGERSAEITKQLLAFARKQVVNPQILDLDKTVENMLSLLRRLIGEDVILHWHPSSEAKFIKIDPSQIDQIMANLCVNARDAINGVGKITIETLRVTVDEAFATEHIGAYAGDFVMLSVSDDGEGMEPELIENIFEPFFTTKGVGRGTGLGLATVFGIVKQNEGFINVTSEVGSGSSFKLYFPRQSSIGNQEWIQDLNTIPRGHDETIMVVEDEDFVIEMSQQMLEGLGYKVLVSRTPTEALKLIQKHSHEITLVISDVVMPEMNGRILTEKLRLFNPNLKVLFMSGYTADVISQIGDFDSKVSLLQKPFSRRDLAFKVQEILNSK